MWLLVSSKVFKVGSAIKGDFTQLAKQFPQLNNYQSFNVIDLEDYCIQWGIISCKYPGSLDALLSKRVGKYLPKDVLFCKHEEWDVRQIHPEYLQYAALDVFASHLIFEKASKRPILDCIKYDTPTETPVA